MLYNERKQLLYRRLKDSLPEDLLVNKGDVMPLSVDAPIVPLNPELNLYLDDLLMISQGIILDERFPYAEQKRPSDVEEQYHMLQVMIAVEIFNKEGSEGLVNFTENGITHTYSGADVSTTLISRITPMVSCI